MNRNELEASIATWVPRGQGISPAVADAARRAVAAAAPPASRTRALLWSVSRLGAWAQSVGLETCPEVILHPSVIERYVAVGMGPWPETTRRSVRTNLRFVARRAVPGLPHPPAPRGLPRARLKAPYSPGEVATLLAQAATQPTVARRMALSGLLGLGLGAGIVGAELRGITGASLRAAHGGLVLDVGGARARTVPVDPAYHQLLSSAAGYAGERFICGGVTPARKNLSADLTARARGINQPRIEGGRLRSTWLVGHLARMGLRALLVGAGLASAQGLSDLVGFLTPLDEAGLVTALGGRA
ncbi:MAG TPA: hypothetical protein VNF50_11770 [Acidimicrobiales bacterium]|nr:hypothetical protein [Acidimicrobiales bacterium]